MAAINNNKETSMATTNEWYQRSVQDYEDKVRDFSADLAFLNEQIQAANNSIADLRRQRAAAAGDDEEVQRLTDTINNVTSRRNGLELRQADTQQALTQAQNSLAQAEADLARVNQAETPQVQPLQPPAAPTADPAARQAQEPVTEQDSQPATALAPAPVVEPVPSVEDDIEGGTVRLPEGTFAGDGYGFTYDENGELIPSDSADAERIRSTPADTQDEFAGDGYGFVYDENGELLPADSVAAEEVRARQPEPPLDYSVTFEDGFDWVIVDNATGSFVETGFATRAQADAALAQLTGQAVGTVPGITPTAATPSSEQIEAQRAAEVQRLAQEARLQNTIQQRLNQNTQGDWRVRLRLLPGANYLYKDTSNSLLKPLRDSDGVIFPYTPRVTTNYAAKYDPYELTHSNYRGYFYKNSHVGELQITGTFTAQDTREAAYLLAVIHFFRSVTKMFYGQDPERGTPPPLVELSGFGEYQFNNHPCLVSNFSYNLPDNVDYIRVTTNNQGMNLSNQQPKASSNPSSPLEGILARVQNAGLTRGAEPSRADLNDALQTVNNTGQSTYVPTKLEIILSLLPQQTRSQVSQQFSLKEFANGSLLRGGFW
jgi:hypothetical protein